MVSKVAIVEFDKDIPDCLKRAIGLIGGIDDLDTAKRPVVVKVGVYDPKAETHTSVSVAGAIVRSFEKTPRIYLAESDN